MVVCLPESDDPEPQDEGSVAIQVGEKTIEDSSPDRSKKCWVTPDEEFTRYCGSWIGSIPGEDLQTCRQVCRWTEKCAKVMFKV